MTQLDDIFVPQPQVAQDKSKSTRQPGAPGQNEQQVPPSPGQPQRADDPALRHDGGQK